MSRQMFLLALTALAIIMLAGCKEPVGVPSQNVHAAAWQTFYCEPTLLNATGHVDWYQSIYGTTLGSCYWYSGTIRVGYEEDQYGRAWPRCNGICQFRVPHLDPLEGGFIPACYCTLFFYQGSHTEQGEGESLLVNSWFLSVKWPPNDDAQAVFWAIWGSTDTVAVDVIHEDDGWCKVPLTADACRAIADSAWTSEPNSWKVSSRAGSITARLTERTPTSTGMTMLRSAGLTSRSGTMTSRSDTTVRRT